MFNAVTFLEDLFLPKADRATSPSDLSEYWREMYEERAAIREYYGGQVREHAEAEALAEVIAAMNRQNQENLEQ